MRAQWMVRVAVLGFGAAAFGRTALAEEAAVPAKMIAAKPTAGKFYQVAAKADVNSVIGIGDAAGIEWRWIEASDWNKDRYFDPKISDNLRPKGGLSLKPKFAANGSKTKSRTS